MTIAWIVIHGAYVHQRIHFLLFGVHTFRGRILGKWKETLIITTMYHPQPVGCFDFGPAGAIGLKTVAGFHDSPPWFLPGFPQVTHLEIPRFPWFQTSSHLR